MYRILWHTSSMGLATGTLCSARLGTRVSAMKSSTAFATAGTRMPMTP